MTRKSKRELERALDGLGETGEYSIQDYMWASLKDAYDGRLSPGERRLLEDPDAHLSPAAKRHIEACGWSV